MGENVQGIRSTNGRYTIDGEVKNSIGNGEAKELKCTTHRYELRGRNASGAGAGGGGERGGKKWDNSSSIINEIYF